MEECTLHCILIGHWRKVHCILIEHKRKVLYIAFLPDNTGKYLILHCYGTMEDSTLYCIVTGQWRKVPYIAFLPDNGGRYLILQSYRTMQESTLHFYLKIQECTLYCILIGQWSKWDNVLPDLNIYLTTEDYPTLYVYLTGGKSRHCPLTLDTWLIVTVYLTLDDQLRLQEVGQRLL